MDEVTIKVELPTDEHGLIGRECPACERYFKLRPGTGLPVEHCRCPYCEHLGDASDFATPEQLEYARSVAINEISQSVIRPMIQRWGRNLERSTRNSMIKLSVKYDHRSIPLSYYQEQRLETSVTCSTCSLEFAIYGVFATCPDCGKPNALDVFRASIEVAGKRLALIDGLDDEALRSALLEDALSSGVSAFDALGKALRRRHPRALSTTPKNLFQNLRSLSDAIEAASRSPISAAFEAEDYAFLLRLFQVRHIYEHNAGVVDTDFCRNVPGTAHLNGRKYALNQETLERFLRLLGKLADAVIERLPPTPQ